ncbi:MAG: LuxR C-terminal-related transcriptional regulator [Rhizobium sp.]
MRHGYFELFDWLEQTKAIQPQHFFDRMKSAYGITHLVYVDVIPYTRSVHLHQMHHTLSPAQCDAVQSAGTDLLLPSLKFLLASVKPVEHATLRQRVPSASTLFHHAASLGIGAEGISYPLLSRANRGALLSIGLPLTAAEMPLFLRSYGRDIQTLAALFHATVVDGERPSVLHGASLITPREREVLRWSAAGKSYWEIAVILGITERTVRFFMSNARQKLDVVSNTQAVAEAVWRGLIPHS